MNIKLKRITKHWRWRAWVATALLVGTASAHHSSAMWDDQRTVEVQGTVKAFEWTNPHVWIWITAEKDQQTWGVEAGAVNSMRRQGWSRDSLQVGEKVTVVVHPSRDDAKQGDDEVGALVSMRRADGTPVPAPQSNAAAQ